MTISDLFESNYDDLSYCICDYLFLIYIQTNETKFGQNVINKFLAN